MALHGLINSTPNGQREESCLTVVCWEFSGVNSVLYSSIGEWSGYKRCLSITVQMSPITVDAGSGLIYLTFIKADRSIKTLILVYKDSLAHVMCRVVVGGQSICLDVFMC